MKHLDKKYVLSKLEYKKKLDPDCTAYGVEHHKYKLNPPIKETKLEKLEQKFKIELPAGYREFVLNIGNGGAGPAYGLYPLKIALTYKDPVPMTGSINDEFVPPKELFDEKSIESGLLKICGLSFPRADYLVLNGFARGQVWQYFDDGGFVPAAKKPVRTDFTNCHTIQDRITRNEEHYQSLFELEEHEIHTFNSWYDEWLHQPVQVCVKDKKWYMFWK